MAKKDKTEKAAKEKKAVKEIVFLNGEQARKAGDKIADEPDWAEDMDHEESTNHHKAIHRTV